MKKEEIFKAILAALAKKSQTAMELHKETSIPLISIHNGVKTLLLEKVISASGTDKDKMYSCRDNKIPDKEVSEKKTEEKTAAPKNQKKGARNTDKIKFGSDEMNKSRYALAVCQANFPKLTMEKIEQTFADLKMSYGCFAPVARAKEVSTDRARFFLKAEELTSTKEGKKLAISNQWTQPLVETFIKLCNKGGLKTK